MTSAEYTAAFDEVKRLGGDDINTATVRTEQEKTPAIFWAYEGTPSLCAPPRLYNQIAVQIAVQNAAFGGALLQTLRRIYGSDRIAFTFVCDEFNGVTRDNNGQVRALSPRWFRTLSQAETENGRSRIYLGIHWGFDCTQGIAQGRGVADFVMRHAFEPAGRSPR